MKSIFFFAAVVLLIIFSFFQKEVNEFSRKNSWNFNPLMTFTFRNCLSFLILNTFLSFHQHFIDTVESILYNNMENCISLGKFPPGSCYVPCTLPCSAQLSTLKFSISIKMNNLLGIFLLSIYNLNPKLTRYYLFS